jgi:hypothetical protein
MNRIHAGGNLLTPKFCLNIVLGNRKQNVWQLKGTEK